MHVVATAGHVDHGKSTLVRALTGMEPDRWEAERRRGLTIDLGFAWATLPSGAEVAFVDVPGHQRFLGNMLAGLGPAPVVMFLVAADGGWQAQSSDHRDALAALDIQHGALVISRADRAAPEQVAGVLATARQELAGTGLRDAPAVVVSAATGAGLDELRSALDTVLAAVPGPDPNARVRLWIDRSFTIGGAGTVVTGTLTAGTVAAGDRLQVVGSGAPLAVTVRGVQSRGVARPALGPVDRVAVNLRGVHPEQVRRGNALVSPDAWPSTDTVDLRRVGGESLSAAPDRLTAHVGSAAVPARLRPFDADHARLTLQRRLPLAVGDRLVLRDPGAHRIHCGAIVLDADPPGLRRRGDGARRATVLAGLDPADDAVAEVARRGAVEVARLRRLGLPVADVPVEVVAVDRWWVHRPVLLGWEQRLRDAVDELRQRDPLAAGISRGAAADLLGLPDVALLDRIAAGAGLDRDGGYLRRPGIDGLGPAEAAVAEVEKMLAQNPFRAPEGDELTALQLGPREISAAQRTGRLLRLAGDVLLLPSAPALAMRELAALPQPFTTSDARQALGSTRRVVIPLLEHLDARGWTRRLDAGHREIVR